MERNILVYIVLGPSESQPFIALSTGYRAPITALTYHAYIYIDFKDLNVHICIDSINITHLCMHIPPQNEIITNYA
jgi:hypothetical protein